MTGDTLRERIAERTRQAADDLYDDMPVAWSPASVLTAGMVAVIVLALAVIGWQVTHETPHAEPTAPATQGPTQAPARATSPPSAPGGMVQGNAPAPTAVAYPLTLPSSALAAWAPDQAPALDVSGRRYRVIESRPGATLAELDDGTRVWLVEQPVEGGGTVESLEAAPTAAAAVVEPTWGPGGTSGGATWDAPPAQPAHVEHAIIPALPFLEAPEPTWGPGGSSGGATW
jgi:hypothetical protein